jgi:hypothetical protein
MRRAHAFSACGSLYTPESGGHQPCAALAYTSTSAARPALANVSFSTSFSIGRAMSSLAAIATRNDALVFDAMASGLSASGVTRPPPWNDATAPTRSGTLAAVRNAIGPPMQ